MSRRRLLKACVAGAADLALAAALVGGDYGLCYRLSRKLESTGVTTASSSSSQIPSSFAVAAPHLSSSPIVTDASYRSPNISVEISETSYDSGSLDTSDDGSYAKYGSQVSYVLADVYVSSVDCLRTEFAQDTYGIGYEEKLDAMASRTGAILAVNGDSYSNNRHRKNGTIIRNGEVFRAAAATDETCVLYHDGTMRTFMPDELDPRQLVADGAWQSWVFGPSLLVDGRAKDSFFTWNYIRHSHPRTAIGYFEPGHYCFLVADGRQPDRSRGMTLPEMASLFEKLGCQLAYNLDGGHCSFMTFGEKVVNHPYSANHKVSDGIFLFDSHTVGTTQGGVVV